MSGQEKHARIRRLRFRKRQRGVILFTVLSALALLSFIVAGVIAISRTDRLLARNAIELTRTKLAAQSAAAYAVASLVAAEKRDPWRIDGVARSLEIEGAKVAVSIQDTLGKVDLNQAPEALMSALFEEAGASRSAARTLSAAIADWRDVDDLSRINGAEVPDYRKAGLPYGPRNRPMENLAELSLVMNASDVLVRTRPYLTLYSQRAVVEPRFASAAVNKAVEKGQSLSAAMTTQAPTTADLGSINGRAFSVVANAARGGTTAEFQLTIRMMRQPQALEAAWQ